MVLSMEDTISPIVTTQRKASGTTSMTHMFKRLPRRRLVKLKKPPIFCFTNYVISLLRKKRNSSIFIEIKQDGQTIFLMIRVKTRRMKRIPKDMRSKILTMSFTTNIRSLMPLKG